MNIFVLSDKHKKMIAQKLEEFGIPNYTMGGKRKNDF